MLKRTISLVTAAAMSFSLFTFTAMAEDSYATRGEVCEMLLTAADDYNPGIQKSDILKGYDDGELHEDRSVTRAEALVMLKRAFGDIPEIKGSNKYLAIPKEDFTDIPDWAQGELADIFDSGIVAGKADGIFAPNDNVTAEQMNLFISRMYCVFGTNEKDDFYAAINKDALDNAMLSEGKSIEGTLYNDITSDLLEDMMKEISASDTEKNSKEDKIKTLYNNYLNWEERNKQGYEPIKADLEAIDAVKSVSEFTQTEVDNFLLINIFIGFAVGADNKNSNQYTNLFDTLSENSKGMYEGKMETQKAAYLKYIKTLFMLCGSTEEDAANAAEEIFDFEKEIAGASYSLAELYDIENTYNEYSLDDLKKIFKTIDIEAVFDYTGLKDKDRFIVGDKGAMNKVAELLTDENLETLKNYAKFKLISSYAEYMSEDFWNAKLTYNAEESGIEGTLSDEYYATDTVSELLASYVGEIYGNKYVTEEMKTTVTEMITGMIDIYRERITNLDWMTDATKEKALKKLDTMGMKVLAPDEWKEIALDSEELKSFEDGGSLVENIRTISKASMKDMYALEGQQVDKTDWITYPHIVNAFYYPLNNDVNFPVAFLQIPAVYSSDASYEENLGGIGFVIGHELSHAFDSSGSQYDENGNAVNWWTDEDAAAFGALCDNVVEYYRGQEGAPGIEIDPAQTLIENIADLGAMSVITELASKQENFDYKKMYENYAKVWMVTMTRETAQSLNALDTHSPASVRVNRVLQSSDKFYEVYGITENDGMWAAPEDRARIW
ncbi:MAG: M13-type metalloendopeptidase [Candidatus Ornithomonoglobus sp.]